MAIDVRWAESGYDRLPGLAAELLEQKLDVIVAAGTQAQLEMELLTPQAGPS